MQIHELNNFGGTLGQTSYLAVDNGNDTGKITTASLLAPVQEELNEAKNTLNGRIDNIIAGGDAPSAAEVTDARHGINGVDYPSLGAAIRTQVGDLRNSIKESAPDAALAFDWTNVAKQLGVLYDLTAEVETNTIKTISSATNRMIVGPFQLSKSVIISCDGSIKYELFKRFSTDDNVTRFTNIYGSWQTSQHIEGANKKIAEICSYYAQLSYSDDRNITSLTELLSLFKIVETNSNPLGLAECDGIINGTGTPYYNHYEVRRLISYKQIYDCDKVLVYCDNPNIRTGSIKGKDVYSSGSDSGLTFGCKSLDVNLENIVWFNDYTNNANVSIELKDFNSFEEVYDFLGLHIEELENENNYISGNQLSDAHLIVEINEYGETVQNNIFESGVFLDDEENIKFAHVPSLQIKNGFAYVAFLCDRTNTYESAPTTEIDLAKIDLSDNTVEYKLIAKSGTYGGVTFNGRCSYPATVLDGDKLYIYFSGTISSVQALCCAVYDLTTDTFTTSVCNVIDGIDTYVFNTTNFDRYIGGKYGIEPLGYEIGICNPTGSGGTFYTTLSSGASGQIKSAILKTTDFVNWTVYDVLPWKYGGDCECVSLFKNNKLYIASRHGYKECTTGVFKYDIATKTIEETMQIGSAASRPTLFLKDDNVVLCYPLAARRTMQMVLIPESNIRSGRLVLSMYSWLGLAYNAILEHNGEVYFAIQTHRSGAETYVEHPKIYFGKSTVIL